MRRIIRTIVVAKLTLLALAAAGLLAAGGMRLRRAHDTWGIVPGDRRRTLAGDELVADADIVETRSLDIAAPPAAVWPWLVQMGYGRGGWYSYDQLDMRRPSLRTIDPDLQGLAEGDVVPMQPEGGFVARIVDAPRALVLYLDSELAKEQAALAGAGRTGAGRKRPSRMPAGLEMAGAMGDVTMPDFRVSWAFVLEDGPEGGTHLIERFRVLFGDGGLSQRLGMPIMGYGVFVMTRQQMLGIRLRAEAAWQGASMAGAAAGPVADPDAAAVTSSPAGG